MAVTLGGELERDDRVGALRHDAAGRDRHRLVRSSGCGIPGCRLRCAPTSARLGRRPPCLQTQRRIRPWPNWETAADRTSQQPAPPGHGRRRARSEPARRPGASRARAPGAAPRRHRWPRSSPWNLQGYGVAKEVGADPERQHLSRPVTLDRGERHCPDRVPRNEPGGGQEEEAGRTGPAAHAPARPHVGARDTRLRKGR